MSYPGSGLNFRACWNRWFGNLMRRLVEALKRVDHIRIVQ